MGKHHEMPIQIQIAFYGNQSPQIYLDFRVANRLSFVTKNIKDIFGVAEGVSLILKVYMGEHH